MARLCDECGKPIQKKIRNDRVHQYCSMACYRFAVGRTGRSPYLRIEHAPCQQCAGQVLQRKNEKLSKFNQRRFCSRRCFVEYRKALRRQITKKDNTGWPEITVGNHLPPGCFASANIADPDGGFVMRYDTPPSLSASVSSME